MSDNLEIENQIQGINTAMYVGTMNIKGLNGFDKYTTDLNRNNVSSMGNEERPGWLEKHMIAIFTDTKNNDPHAQHFSNTHRMTPGFARYFFSDSPVFPVRTSPNTSQNSPPIFGDLHPTVPKQSNQSGLKFDNFALYPARERD